MTDDRLEALFLGRDKLFIQQRKEWAQILIDWESPNKYALLDETGRELGVFAERCDGFLSTLSRLFFRSHRGLEIVVFGADSQPLLLLSRDFFWFFSDLAVTTGLGERLGSIHRRFAFFSKRYELLDADGLVFATVESPIWRIWTFPVIGADGRALATIHKKWGGFLSEVFTDADTYLIELADPADTPISHLAVILAAAISIDFDFFEHNQRKGGLVNLLPDLTGRASANDD